MWITVEAEKRNELNNLVRNELAIVNNVLCGVELEVAWQPYAIFTVGVGSTAITWDRQGAGQIKAHTSGAVIFETLTESAPSCASNRDFVFKALCSTRAERSSSVGKKSVISRLVATSSSLEGLGNSKSRREE